jgi:hypothetical protein
MPYMRECMYERPPLFVLSGSLPPGEVLRSAMKVLVLPRGTKPLLANRPEGRMPLADSARFRSPAFFR